MDQNRSVLKVVPVHEYTKAERSFRLANRQMIGPDCSTLETNSKSTAHDKILTGTMTALLTALGELHNNYHKRMLVKDWVLARC